MPYYDEEPVSGTEAPLKEVRTVSRDSNTIREEYERLNHDGTITKTILTRDEHGATKNVETYKMDKSGIIRKINNSEGQGERASNTQEMANYDRHPQELAPKQPLSFDEYKENIINHGTRRLQKLLKQKIDEGILNGAGSLTDEQKDMLMQYATQKLKDQINKKLDPQRYAFNNNQNIKSSEYEDHVSDERHIPDNQTKPNINFSLKSSMDMSEQGPNDSNESGAVSFAIKPDIKPASYSDVRSKNKQNAYYSTQNNSWDENVNSKRYGDIYLPDERKNIVTKKKKMRSLTDTINSFLEETVSNDDDPKQSSEYKLYEVKPEEEIDDEFTKLEKRLKYFLNKSEAPTKEEMVSDGLKHIKKVFKKFRDEDKSNGNIDSYEQASDIVERIRELEKSLLDKPKDIKSKEEEIDVNDLFSAREIYEYGLETIKKLMKKNNIPIKSKKEYDSIKKLKEDIAEQPQTKYYDYPNKQPNTQNEPYISLREQPKRDEKQKPNEVNSSEKDSNKFDLSNFFSQVLPWKQDEKQYEAENKSQIKEQSKENMPDFNSFISWFGNKIGENLKSGTVSPQSDSVRQKDEKSSFSEKETKSSTQENDEPNFLLRSKKPVDFDQLLYKIRQANKSEQMQHESEGNRGSQFYQEKPRVFEKNNNEVTQEKNIKTPSIDSILSTIQEEMTRTTKKRADELQNTSRDISSTENYNRRPISGAPAQPKIKTNSNCPDFNSLVSWVDETLGHKTATKPIPLEEDAQNKYEKRPIYHQQQPKIESKIYSDFDNKNGAGSLSFKIQPKAYKSLNEEPRPLGDQHKDESVPWWFESSVASDSRPKKRLVQDSFVDSPLLGDSFFSTRPKIGSFPSNSLLN